MDPLHQIIAHLTHWWSIIKTAWYNSVTPEPLPLILITLATLAITIPYPIWKPTRQAATIIHEIGHAVIARISGRKIAGIKLHTDTSGVTLTEGKQGGLGFILTLMAGYTAPTTLGTAMIWATTNNYAGAALTLLTAVLALAFFYTRNILAILCIGAAALGSAWLWFNASAPIVTYTVLAIGVFLVIAGIRCCFDLSKAHQEKTGSTDAEQLADATFLIPSIAWVGFFHLWAIAGIAVSFLNLLHSVQGT